MNPLAAPARMSADDLNQPAALTKQDEIAKRYEACSWGASTEQDLNHDVMVGRNTGPRP